MIELLSKIKDECHKQDIDLMHSEINGDAIKLACTINGRRDTELNAYIVPDGDNYGIYTVTPQGAKSETKCVTENEIIPELVASLTGEEPEKVIKEDENGGVDQVTIEVEDGVFDTKEVAHDTYKNSRYAYSDKYHKMGTIVEIRQLNSKIDDSELPSDAVVDISFTEPAGKTLIKAVSKSDAMRAIEAAREVKPKTAFSKTAKGKYTLSIQKTQKVDSIMMQLMGKYEYKDILK